MRIRTKEKGDEELLRWRDIWGPDPIRLTHVWTAVFALFMMPIPMKYSTRHWKRRINIEQIKCSIKAEGGIVIDWAKVRKKIKQSLWLAKARTTLLSPQISTNRNLLSITNRAWPHKDYFIHSRPCCKPKHGSLEPENQETGRFPPNIIRTSCSQAMQTRKSRFIVHGQGAEKTNRYRPLQDRIVRHPIGLAVPSLGRRKQRISKKSL